MTYPSPKQLDEIYAKRERDVAELGRKAVIQAADLVPLDKLGRCAIADNHWAKCSPEAREALLKDQHHFVRSCAEIAAKRHT